MASMTGNSNFNSLQATMEKRMSHGLSLLANVTWSKSYDDMPQASRVGNTEDLNAGSSYVYPLYPDNATNIPAAARVSDIKALDRGLSDIDHPLAISVSYMWDLPKMRGGNAALRFIANGWSTSGLIQHRSGEALTAYMGTDQSLTGLSQDRAQQDFSKPAYSRDAGGAGDCPAKTCVNWFNNAAFSVPANTGPGTGFGNIVKGSLRGPGQSVWHAAMARSFRLHGERATLQFRAEYFNVLNHTLLNNPSVSNPVGSSTSFGTITGTGDPRIAQFALKFVF
jgi:hypothetical protein